ncbi:hypothetical protein PGTUg99_024629 [Puccinia graminis f. sp. tritici]|uniref:Uncharacterized protein n=1 Tax=Puccinia graminis f. sp. tritici TaxID=56615 RepID=A0A5B0PGL6_PUCGR|nr:hypothetical protein PGTUg99_024629 [Puccinia graminis f. sp. tritici]
MRSVAAYIQGLVESKVGRKQGSTKIKAGIAASTAHPVDPAAMKSRGPDLPLPFGDFFVREHRSQVGSCNLFADRPSKYTSYSLSEGFQRESEKIYLANLLRSAGWKLDTRLVPLLALFYFVSEMARLSLHNIRSIGLQTDLRTDDSQFTLCLIVTLIPIIVSFPSQIILGKWRPRGLPEIQSVRRSSKSPRISSCVGSAPSFFSHSS